MMTNYENYVREYLHENNPETDSLLERARASLDTSEACAGVIDIFNSELGGNYSERLDGLGGYLEKNGSQRGSLNTFPFGKPTREIYPDFVGICKGERSIRSVLDKAEDQCEKMIKAFPYHVHKTILILTDKWNDPVFRMNYAGTFINYANRYNIVFMFLLVTDFGVSYITEANGMLSGAPGMPGRNGLGSCWKSLTAGILLTWKNTGRPIITV